MAAIAAVAANKGHLIWTSPPYVTKAATRKRAEAVNQSIAARRGPGALAKTNLPKGYPGGFYGRPGGFTVFPARQRGSRMSHRVDPNNTSVFRKAVLNERSTTIDSSTCSRINRFRPRPSFYICSRPAGAGRSHHSLVVRGSRSTAHDGAVCRCGAPGPAPRYSSEHRGTADSE